MKTRVIIAFCIGIMLAPITEGLAAGGTITGKVELSGAAPPPKKITVAQDTSVCGTEKLLQDVQVSPDKGIRYAVVRLRGVKAAASAAVPNVVIDQKGCVFTPPVVVVPKGASLDVANDDGILHNVHAHSTINRPFNRTQPGFIKKISTKFEQPEIIRLGCDIHSWMTAWVVVVEDLSAVTDASGNFRLPNVPAGTYKLEVWHPALGTQTKDVTVSEGGEAKVDFQLAAK